MNTSETDKREISARAISAHAYSARIKEYRVKAKLTQGQLAEKAEIDANNLSRIECGRTAPTVETLIKLSDALNVTPNDILLESFDAPPALLDAELAALLEGLSADGRKKVIEYIRFLKQSKAEV